MSSYSLRRAARLVALLLAGVIPSEAVLAEREWLVGTFSVADILMADVLRLIGRLGGLEEYPACRGYVARATARKEIASGPSCSSISPAAAIKALLRSPW